ncbi:MAG: PepSY-associated TM helix domain-containing protein [Roseateles sp.]
MSTSSTALNRLFWRLHFWAGLVASPIILFAALTGLLYVFTPQIEAWRHADVDRVAVGAQRLPLDAQVAAALAAAPDAALRYVVPAHAADDSTQVWLRAPHAHHGAAKGGEHDHGLPAGSIVYVNPYTGQVLGRLQEMERFKTWAKKLHSNALQGDGWRWLIELGASWMLVLFATGLVMWWPRSQASGGDGWRALIPRWGRGRATWRDLHAVVAIALGLVMAIVLVTGLTWAEHSGKRFREMQTALGQDAPRVPKTLRSAPGDGPSLSWQAVLERSRAQAPDIAMQITPPPGPDGVWRIENFDRTQPTGRFNLALDARRGATMFSSGWERFPTLARATAVGIPFHRGEFGVWNQVLLALAALAAVFSVVSGLVMWWQRRPRGKVGAPTLPNRHLRQAPLWLWPLMAALAYAMPVFGWSLLAMLAAEALTRLLHRSRTPA